MKNIIVLTPVLFAMVMIFLLRTNRVSGKKAAETAAVFAFFPLIVFLIDRFFTPGLWQKFLWQDTLEYWAARIAYGFAVIGIGFRSFLISIAGGITALLIICSAANDLSVDQDKTDVPAKSEMEKKVSRPIIVPISSIDSGETKIIPLEDGDYLIVQPGGRVWSGFANEDFLWFKTLSNGTRQIIDTIQPHSNKPLGTGNVYLTAARKLAPGEKTYFTIQRMD